VRIFQKRLIDWIEHRTGLESAVKNFLFEEIPASSGWLQVFGSVAVFLFLLQAFTGLLLAFNYAPTPGDAYNSVKYIVTELTGGQLIRGLHHWGASLMIVVVVLHMIQVFIYGAYKKPREATWMVGVTLLLITFAYGLTGYLLPWDNRAYWGTVVATQIAGKAPLVGPYLSRLLGSDGSIGVVTFARFFALHVLLLPPVTTFLIAFHIYLVRKHGVAPTPGESRPNKKFFPEQVFRDTLGIFVAFAILFVMAVAVKVPLERLADPTDTGYVPRPDWYFLFFFQTLKFFGGALEVFGSVVLPGCCILALLLTPFMDRGAAKTLRQRTFAIAVVVLAVVGWTGLTAAAIVSSPASSVVVSEGPVRRQEWQELSPVELAGIGYFREEHCFSCHNLGGGNSKIGPDLASPPIRRSPSWMIEHFKNPSRLIPGTAMPPIHLNDTQLAALVAFLMNLNPESAKSLEKAPMEAARGALIFQENECGTCHLVNGTGAKVGPTLNGLSVRRTPRWIEEQIRNPKAHLEGSAMPPYNLTPRDMEHIIFYLLSLPQE
jgi:ubiquinol-cytochrome c reductase cytochrome b subunit